MNHRFSQASLDFITRATKQKNPEWLAKNHAEYEDLLVAPMRELMETAGKALQSEAPGYRFPRRNFVRLKRHSPDPGEALYKDWVAVSVSKDSGSRYDSLPNLYCEFSPEDILSAGGLYVPSADQTKHIRKWIDQDPALFEALFREPEFKKRFKDFGDERVLKTKPRDYPIDHPRIGWLKLSAWYVWRPFPKKVAFSKDFSSVLIDDWRQILRLNRILDRYITTWPKAGKTLDSVEAIVPRQMDW